MVTLPRTIIMTDTRAQLTLHTWMSAAFPTGAFTCSHGIEQSISDGRIANADDCEDWISGVMQYGSGWNDAVLAACACNLASTYLEQGEINTATRADGLRSELSSLNDLALALCCGAERLRETTQLGNAFARAVVATVGSEEPVVTDFLDGDISLPVATGASGALAGITARHLLPASMQASSSNLVWISTRLIPLGQTQALQIITRLQTLMEQLGLMAMNSSPDDLGSCTLLADMASIEHENLHSRICIT